MAHVTTALPSCHMSNLRNANITLSILGVKGYPTLKYGSGKPDLVHSRGRITSAEGDRLGLTKGGNTL